MATNGSSRCSSHSSNRVFCLPKCYLCELDHSVPPIVLGCLHCPEGFLHFDSHLAFWLLVPCSSLCSDSTTLPILPCQFLCKLLGRRHASPHQPAAALHLSSLMWSILMQAFSVPTSSALNINSYAPSLKAASWKPSLKSGSWTFNGLVPLRK